MAKQQYVLIDGAWEPIGGAPGANGANGVDGAPGPAGPPGTAYLNAQWNFNQNTVTSPNSGTMRMDNTVYANTTQLYVNEVDRDGLNRTSGLDQAKAGDQIIMQSAQGRAVWNLTGAFDVGTYRTFNVTLAESSGSRPSASSPTTLYFATVGSASSVILSGTATPVAGTGAVGDYYLDTDDRVLYGPKAAGGGGYGPSQSAFTSQLPNGTATYSGFSVGSDVTFAVAGRITGIRVYRYSSSTASSKTLKIWSSGGVLLATASTSGDTGTGWKNATLVTPIAVTAGQTVRAVLDAAAGDPISINDALPGNVVSGDMTIAKLSYYITNIGYPNTQHGVNNYMTDVVFEAGVAPVSPWPVALKSVPPGGTTGQSLKKLSGTDYDLGWVT